MRNIQMLSLAGALAFSGAPALPVSAATLSYTADLKSASDSPPNTSKATGKVMAWFDTVSNKLSWAVTYTGLSGPATAAHFHGPTAMGAHAAPVAPVPPAGLATPMNGEAMPTDAQAEELADGKWSFNIHTAAHAGGEIRGQMMKK